MPDKKSPPVSISRREFLRFAGCATGAGLAFFLLRPQATTHGVLPPGALQGDQFREVCLHCGKCAAACEQRAIQLDSSGYPYINGLHGWCDFNLRCVEACPTQALNWVDPGEAKIALAVIDRNRCIAWNWNGCRLCFEKCAKLQQAVWLDADLRPYISETLCNGCGACVYICPQSAVEGVNKKYGKAVALHKLPGF